jgi:predicted metal-dependent hydrolase
MSPLKARDLLNKKRPWIEREVRRITNRRRVFDGRKLLYKGIPYKLKVVKSKQKRVKVTDHTIVVSLGDGSHLRESVRNWMARETQRYVTKRVKQYERKLGFNVKDLEVDTAPVTGGLSSTGSLPRCRGS